MRIKFEYIAQIVYSALFRETTDVTRFVISTNEVILNCSCRDMKVGASYVKYLHKTDP